jgi:short-subunit dehydrogenase
MDLKKYGRALITGASSGIGEAYAKKLGSLENDLVLVARTKDKLDALAQELKQRHPIQIEVIQADLSLDSDVKEMEQWIKTRNDISILINNAGFGITALFSECDIEKQLSMVQVHDIASVRFARAALPGMLQKQKGVIINVASILGYLPYMYHSIYCASKAFLNSFSENLQLELKHTGITVQALNPGLTRSGFHSTEGYKDVDSTGAPDFMWMTSEAVVEQSLNALGKKAIFIAGFKNRLMVRFKGLVVNAMQPKRGK